MCNRLNYTGENIDAQQAVRDLLRYNIIISDYQIPLTVE